jgi:hypothetical protein
VGFGLITGFIELLQIHNYKSLYGAITNSHSLRFITHALSLPSLLSLHQSSATGFQWQTFPFMDSQPVPVPQPQQLFTHSALTNSLMLAPLYTLKSIPFWSCSRTASISHWLCPPIICNVLCLAMYCTVLSKSKSCYD